MELKRSDRNLRSQRRITVPDRSTNPLRAASESKRPLQYAADKPSGDTSLFGFEDLAAEVQNLDEIRFRDILRAWIKKSFTHNDLETKQNKTAPLSGKKVKTWKNDLKWAMMADLDETDLPHSNKHHHDSAPSTQQAVKPSLPDNKTIDINITFGSLPKLSANRFSKIRSSVASLVRPFKAKQKVIIGLIILGGVAIIFSPQLQRQWAVVTGGDSDSIKTENIASEPDFKTVLPEGKKASDVNGKLLQPPKSDPIYSFVDTVDGVRIRVTQQPIPDRLQPNVGENVANLAKEFNATEKVTVNSLTVYIGTSVQGPQSVIFTKDELLVLMKSDSKISNDAWGQYAKSLK